MRVKRAVAQLNLSDRLHTRRTLHPMKPQTQLPTEHRIARLAAWAIAVLVWLLTGAVAHTTHRRRLQNVTLQEARCFIRRLVIIRAAQILPSRPGARRRLSDAPSGFRRRTHVRFSERRIAGVWLRRRLAHNGGFAEQIAHLLELLRNWRALGVELARRRRKRLTRLYSIVPASPPAVRCSVAPPLSLSFIDSS